MQEWPDGSEPWSKAEGKGCGTGMPSLCLCSPDAPLCSPTGKLSEPHCEHFFMEVPSGRHDGLNPWHLVTELNLQSLPPLRRVELKIPSL